MLSALNIGASLGINDVLGRPRFLCDHFERRRPSIRGASTNTTVSVARKQALDCRERCFANTGAWARTTVTRRGIAFDLS
jgi:hypothetical protein